MLFLTQHCRRKRSWYQTKDISRFVLQINCENEKVYTVSIGVTIQPRQSSLIKDINLEFLIRYRLKYQEGELCSDKLVELDSLPSSVVGLKNKFLNVEGIEFCSNLENLDYLDVADNHTKNISELQYLKNIHLIGLSHNEIEDIFPLVNNTSLSSGVYIFLTHNPLNEISINEYIPALQERRRQVSW